MQAQIPYALFPTISAGADWLTCTSSPKGVSDALEDAAMAELYKEKAEHGQVRSALRLGFSGHQGDGIFCGRRDSLRMVILSGPRCTPLAKQFIPLATNVSRLDLQVTVWTEGEVPHLAEWSYKKLNGVAPRRGTPSKLLFIQGRPAGETLNVGSRVSDSYGRLYDKAAESKLGEPRTVWRYECEFKRAYAKRFAVALAEAERTETYAIGRVHEWWTKKGLQPSFCNTGEQLDAVRPLMVPSRNVLTWFRESLQKTVSRAISQHGPEAVIDALNLSHYLKAGDSDGNFSSRVDGHQPDICSDVTRAVDSKRVLVH